jgi:hypothetical protein
MTPITVTSGTLKHVGLWQQRPVYQSTDHKQRVSLVLHPLVDMGIPTSIEAAPIIRRGGHTTLRGRRDRHLLRHADLHKPRPGVGRRRRVGTHSA